MLNIIFRLDILAEAARMLSDAPDQISSQATNFYQSYGHFYGLMTSSK